MSFFSILSQISNSVVEDYFYYLFFLHGGSSLFTHVISALLFSLCVMFNVIIYVCSALKTQDTFVS